MRIHTPFFLFFFAFAFSIAGLSLESLLLLLFQPKPGGVFDECERV